MYILSSKQISLADKATIKNKNISSIDLMERAAQACFQWLHNRFQEKKIKIHIFCGIGNNGGDGMALARHLKEHGYNIEVNVVNYSDKRSKDFLINLRGSWCLVCCKRELRSEITGVMWDWVKSLNRRCMFFFFFIG